MKLHWEIDGVDVTVEKLEDGIEAGMEKAVDRILEILEREAKDTIRVNDRIFNKELINAFTDQTTPADIRTGVNSRFLNTARHAGAVEHGVHPSKYADGGPPIHALMPWVLRNLQGWDLSGSGSGGNALKQSVTEEVTQSVSNEVDLFGVQNKMSVQLELDNKEDLENSLKNSALESQPISDHIDRVKMWKVDSNPKPDARYPEAVTQYSSDLIETFGIDADPRGIEYRTPDPTDKATKEAILTQHELSKIFAYNHLDDGTGSFQAHRQFGRTEVANMGKLFWDNPEQDEWVMDINAVNNYSTYEGGIDIFDNGMRHEIDVDIQDDLLLLNDHLIKTENHQEAEVHLPGGNDYTFRQDEFWMTNGMGESLISVDEIITEDFININFSALTDDQLMGIRATISAMYEKDKTVSTQSGRDRLDAWLDEFLSRNLHRNTAYSSSEWTSVVDDVKGNT